ncbi:DUF2892 domain-containing protein [Emticicia sp. BO119]|uniref:YgaP family membrane protein n=1 Tax=Emticicia sp. BO119 TaxID=2757768 RepID=UPI0015F0B9A2|nr:DUF2892 domain-containing protein [Emticicia sp. BO119]MBA4850634.1 DUF2892 domain-containing protein [Emticicia sp. BO119]
MKNLGKIDRIIRLMVSVVLIVLYYTDVVSGTWGILAMVVASIFVVTSLVSFCPLYTIFGINTCSVKK